MLKYFKLAKEIIKQKKSPANIKVVINGTKKPALMMELASLMFLCII